jgi:16S rRNA (cytosine967-C5)-methyltransferase
MPGFSEGLFTAQNRASQLVAPLTAPAPGERVLDACGAPGQKAAHMAQLMGNRGRIVVLDIDAGRAGHTRENLVRMGAECAAVELGNAADPATFSHMGVFDRALVDAPCSNSGVLRHNPEAKYRLTLERIRDQADLQLRMLCACGEALRRDGILVYAVCSVTEEETTSVVERFLRARTDYAVSPFLPVESPIPGLVDARGFFATFPPPPEFPCDGFFVARFVHIG